MSLTISIRFLTGRAHLHPWQTHHSEGRVEWPPSPWRLLRALVAVAGRGLTPLPAPDWFADPGKKPRATKNMPTPVWPALDYISLPDLWSGPEPGEIPLSRLARLLVDLSATPNMWLPKTSGGHTRQYFPIHEGGVVKNTGSAVFDTFAAISNSQPLLFHWPDVDLDQWQQKDLKVLLDRMTYFGRAESWCRAQAYTSSPDEVEGVICTGPERTHWQCVCIEDHGKPERKEYRDYTLERRLAPVKNLKAEVADLMPRTRPSNGNSRNSKDAELFRMILQSESCALLLLRCLLRESGQDIRDGLERPIGTQWVHYAAPRAIHDVPRPKPKPRPRTQESVNLVRYALNTATVSRPVLPPLSDTLLVADRFRSAIMALCLSPSPNLSGHEADGLPSEANTHARWWPFDEDNDGFIDHVMVWASGGFDIGDVDALRRLTRLRQRGGRPDLLVTPIFVGEDSAYPPWQVVGSGNPGCGRTTTFVSATPYFCPVHLSHGRGRSGKVCPIVPELLKSLKLQGLIKDDEEVQSFQDLVFDYAPDQLAQALDAVDSDRVNQPLPPRQYYPVIAPPLEYPPLPRFGVANIEHYGGACVKDPDAHYTFGLSIGLLVADGTRFIRAMSFCRRRRNIQAKGPGRMFVIRFHERRPSRPFAIGDQCHFGLGLFVPVQEA